MGRAGDSRIAPRDDSVAVLSEQMMNTKGRGAVSDRRAGGFTLVELLVVTAIICILAALLLPALSMTEAQARSAACKNHLHQIGAGLKMYVGDNHSTFPYYLGPPGPSYGDEKGQRGRSVGLVYWSSKLFPYYPLNWTNRLFHCPGYKRTNTGPYPDTGPLFAGTIARFGSYAYNVQGSAGDAPINAEFGLGPVVFWKVPPVSEGQIKVPSEMVSMTESRWLTANVVSFPGGTVQGGSGGVDEMQCGSPTRLPFDPGRHGKNYNLLLCDGHVSAMSPWVLFNPTNTAPMWNYDHQPHPELWPP